jgi:hypothetical protein
MDGHSLSAGLGLPTGYLFMSVRLLIEKASVNNDSASGRRNFRQSAGRERGGYSIDATAARPFAWW